MILLTKVLKLILVIALAIIEDMQAKLVILTIVTIIVEKTRVLPRNICLMYIKYGYNIKLPNVNTFNQFKQYRNYQNHVETCDYKALKWHIAKIVCKLRVYNVYNLKDINCVLITSTI